MKKQYVLGIDYGGTFGKAALFDQKGAQVAAVQRQIPVNTDVRGRAVRDMNELREQIFLLLRTLLAVTDVSAEAISGIGLSGHGKGLYLLNRDGKVFTGAILSTDRRAAAVEAEMRANEELARYVRAHNFQNILACQPVCLLNWLKRFDAETYSEIGTVFSGKDFLRYCLTDTIHAEITDLSGTNLLNFETRQYDERLLELFGISEIRSCLPPIVSPFTIVGGVTERAAAATGLRAGTPVCGGVFDIDACGLAAGMTSPDVITMIAGTWAINEYITRTPVNGADAPMNSLYCLDGYYLVEECSPTSSGNLQWWMDKVDGDLTYRQVNHLVASAPADAEVYFLPFVTGSSVGEGADGTLVGLNAHCGKEHILRALYEGVAFNAKTQLERLLRHRNAPLCIRLAGGLTKSEPWVQIFADVLDMPIEIFDQGDCELGCFGAALIAGVATGVYREIETFVSRLATKRIEPHAETAKIYRGKYSKYCELISAMKHFWHLDETRNDGNTVRD